MVIAAQRLGLDPGINGLVDDIVVRLEPELVLLFGSRASGTARDDSDYDLLIVLRDGVDTTAAFHVAFELVRAAHVEADILTRSATEYQRWQHDPGFLDWIVAREGRLLYASGAIPQRSLGPDRVREVPTEGRDAWIARADEDYRNATDSMASARPTWAAICFHSHATVEKLLKAIFVTGGAYPPKVHSLSELLEQLPRLGGDAGLAADCSILDGLYVRSRYGPDPMPTPEEARGAFVAAGRARVRLLGDLGRSVD